MTAVAILIFTIAFLCVGESIYDQLERMNDLKEKELRDKEPK